MASQGSKLWEGKNMGEPNRRCSKICHAAHLSALSLVIMVFFSSWYRRPGAPSQRGIYVLLLGREGRELFLCLLFLICLQLKLILMPKWPILGWHILLPFTPKDSVMSLLSQSYLPPGSHCYDYLHRCFPALALYVNEDFRVSYVH